jgi:hypothetical protein
VDRRRFLSLCGAGTGAFLAGCFGGTGETPEPGGTSDAPGETPGVSPASPTSEDLLYRNEWTELTIGRDDGEILALPELEEGGKLSYSVSAEGSVGFDVYVFAEESVKDTYERWVNAPADLRSETGGIVGYSGATARDVTGSVRREDVLIDSGRWWIAVDYSDFNGGVPRATLVEDGPDTITVDVSVQVVATGF